MLLSNIGAEQRYEYRAIGDIVNTASRIQGLNRVLGTRVLLSATTIEGTTSLATRDVGTFLLRGKRLPVRVLEPLAASGGQLDDESLAAFAAATDVVSRWRVAGGARAIRRARGAVPDGWPEPLLRRAGRASGAQSPPRTWTGAVRLTTK